jgi:hypothetical protein
MVPDVMAHGARIAAYAAAGLIGLFELGVLVALANPDVSADYRRFFIDRTTNCWTRDVAGERRFGQTIDMVIAEGTDPYRHAGSLMLVCGWLSPSGTGTWSIGPEAALRFDTSAIKGNDLDLHLELLPYVSDTHPTQRVTASVAGEEVAALTLDKNSLRQQTIHIPARLVDAAPGGKLDLWFAFPDAISPQTLKINDDNRKLAIRLITLRAEAIAK